jgi:hypothetical protein
MGGGGKGSTKCVLPSAPWQHAPAEAVLVLFLG